ncbi:hypothetical protein SAMN05216270_102182 [Glycomyces harbinensis]|uniref:Uncharacterized protein n=2 Tax=Glycomyces harbinensis TaxID=58114 RepID=A0A1G6SN17_9ACTN|nr:hypothetical protein SAMN05216270_102182 [Glycomyces harbinensis]
MIEIRTRELVFEKYPGIGDRVWCATREEWVAQTESFNYDDTSPYTPTEKWSGATNCAAPYDADDSDLQSLREEAEDEASHRHHRSATQLASLLYPDALQDAANTVDRFVEFKASFDEFIEANEENSFKQISDLFEGWTGGSDNAEAFLAFGHTRETAGTQRSLLREIIQVTTAEFSIQAETRNSLGARLSKLAEKLIEVQRARSFIIENLYITTSMFTPLGYADGAMSIIENFGLDDGSGEWNTSWFGAFKDKYLIGEYEVGTDSDTFEALASGIDDCLESVESMLTDGRSEITALAEEINADYSGLTQGEAY